MKNIIIQAGVEQHEEILKALQNHNITTPVKFVDDIESHGLGKNDIGFVGVDCGDKTHLVERFILEDNVHHPQEILVVGDQFKGYFDDLIKDLKLTSKHLDFKLKYNEEFESKLKKSDRRKSESPFWRAFDNRKKY
jgi:hypothetical protein